MTDMTEAGGQELDLQLPGQPLVGLGSGQKAHGAKPSRGPGHIEGCTGKRAYGRKEAKAFARNKWKRARLRLHVYHCIACGDFHVTSHAVNRIEAEARVSRQLGRAG